MFQKKVLTLFSTILTIVLSSCQSSNNVLKKFYGEYVLVDNDKNYDQCKLILKEDKSYQIIYQDRIHNGSYTYKSVDNAIAFVNRSPIYFGEPNYPKSNNVKSYDLHLYILDEYDFLPEPLVKFFDKSYKSNQYLYIHTFADAKTYEKYGRTRQSVEKIEKSSIYKEVSYYENQQAYFDKDGYPIPELKDQRFDFYQITDK